VLEGERRATKVAIGIAAAGFVSFSLATFLPGPVRAVILGLLLLIGLLIIILFFVPSGKVKLGDDTPKKRFDERDIMFARARLSAGSPEYESYYLMRPENKTVDDRTRAKPGLLSPQSQKANQFHFASTTASFELTGALRETVQGPVAPERQELPVDKMTSYLKGLAAYFGALDVGVAELKPYHIYSHIGRGSGTYGAPITLEHSYAIAFTVEMDFEMVGTGPNPPVTMESGKQYVDSARIAVQLAAVLRALGYQARAHIDGNYRVIAPLVARDAGLGEIGRMGLVMTPKQGPRVRLGVVTTDAELNPDGRQPDLATIDFCTICKKCAENCPSLSISFEDREEIDGAIRWQINAETCFHYWNVIGTDCGRCMAVCPYSHPDTPAHNLVRWGISKSGNFRLAANWMDDIFYGKKPSERDAPDWAQVP